MYQGKGGDRGGYEDYRGSPYRQQYERPRDTSPQRNTYDRQFDRRANPHSEDYRGSPYKQQYERPRDTSPQRNTYDRQFDRRANPHSEVFDPKFDPSSPLPPYHNLPQPQYQRYFQDYRDDYYKAPGHYDEIKPAGRANKYNTRITDLLTSIKEPEFKDDRMNKLAEVNKGYLVMVRFRPQDLADVITAVQESVSTLTAHDGYCIGFSEPKLMQIVMPSHQSLAGERWWDARGGNTQQSRFAVACFWFKDYVHARDWFQTGSVRFKQPEFPNSHPYQVIAIPLTYGMSSDSVPFTPDRDEITLLWSEYPSIYERYEYDFFDNCSRPENQIMKWYGGNPYVSACRYKPGDIPLLNKFGSPGYARYEAPIERFARSWRGVWMSPDTVVTVSTFPSMRAVSDFYYDPEYTNIRKQMSRYTEPVIVAITLQRVQGTSRR